MSKTVINKHKGYLRRDSNPDEVRTIRPRPFSHHGKFLHWRWRQRAAPKHAAL